MKRSPSLHTVGYLAAYLRAKDIRTQHLLPSTCPQYHIMHRLHLSILEPVQTVPGKSIAADAERTGRDQIDVSLQLQAVWQSAEDVARTSWSDTLIP